MSEGPILASASARRRALLEAVGLRFEVCPADVEEAPQPGESAEAMVRRLAESKALAVSRSWPGRFVLAADTTVVVDGTLLEKPRSETDARDMLRRLSDRWHEVWSGVSAPPRQAFLAGGSATREACAMAVIASANEKFRSTFARCKAVPSAPRLWLHGLRK